MGSLDVKCTGPPPATSFSLASSISCLVLKRMPLPICASVDEIWKDPSVDSIQKKMSLS